LKFSRKRHPWNHRESAMTFHSITASCLCGTDAGWKEVREMNLCRMWRVSTIIRCRTPTRRRRQFMWPAANGQIGCCAALSGRLQTIRPVKQCLVLLLDVAEVVSRSAGSPSSGVESLCWSFGLESEPQRSSERHEVTPLRRSTDECARFSDTTM